MSDAATLDYITIGRTVERIAVEDAERDLLCMTLIDAERLAALRDLGITPASLRDARHAAFLSLLIHICGSHELTGRFTLAGLVSAIAHIRQHGSTNARLAAAGDLDGAFLLSLWTFAPSRDWTETVQFVATAQRERTRDVTVEACIAAIAHGSDPSLVLPHLDSVLDPEVELDPDGSSRILAIPPRQEPSK